MLISVAQLEQSGSGFQGQMILMCQSPDAAKGKEVAKEELPTRVWPSAAVNSTSWQAATGMLISQTSLAFLRAVLRSAGRHTTLRKRLNQKLLSGPFESHLAVKHPWCFLRCLGELTISSSILQKLPLDFEMPSSKHVAQSLA